MSSRSRSTIRRRTSSPSSSARRTLCSTATRRRIRSSRKRWTRSASSRKPSSPIGRKFSTSTRTSATPPSRHPRSKFARPRRCAADVRCNDGRRRNGHLNKDYWMPAPSPTFARIARVLDAIVRGCGMTIAWLILPMVLSLVWEVTARYLFNAPTTWAYDMTFMLYGTFFMLGSAWTLQRGGHIRTDIYYANWSRRTRAWVDLACYLVFFFPAMAIFAWLGWEYFWKSYEQNERIV